jgi:hypothetical protein
VEKHAAQAAPLAARGTTAAMPVTSVVELIDAVLNTVYVVHKLGGVVKLDINVARGRVSLHFYPISAIGVIFLFGDAH